MPKWTQKHTDQFSQALAEGRLDDICRMIASFKNFDTNVLQPVDSTAFAQFRDRVNADVSLQRSLASLLVHEQQAIRRLAVFLFTQLERFPASVFMETWQAFLSSLDAQLLERYRVHIRANWDYYQEDFKSQGLSLEQVLSENRTPGINFYHVQDYTLLESLLEGVCACLSEECREIWNYVEKRFNNFLYDGRRELRQKFARGWKRLEREAARKLALQAARDKWGDAHRARLLKLLASADLAALRELAILYPKLKPEDLDFNDPDEVRRAAERLTGDDALQATVVQLLAGETGSLNLIAHAWLSMLETPPRELILKALLALPKTSRGGKWLDGEYLRSINQKSFPLFRQLMRFLLREPSLELFIAIQDDWQLRGDECGKEIVLLLHEMDGLEQTRQILRGLVQQCEALPGATREEKNYRTSLNVYLRDLDLLLDIALSERDPLQAVTCPRAAGHMGGLNDYGVRREYMDAEDFPGKLATYFDSGEWHDVDAGFRIAWHHPDLLERIGLRLIDLTVKGLWMQDRHEMIKAVHRLHALAAFGRCTPAEAAAAIEPAFTIEEPALWLAAAEALRELRKQDPAIRLANPARIRELLERDPKKYRKHLEPLLD